MLLGSKNPMDRIELVTTFWLPRSVLIRVVYCVADKQNQLPSLFVSINFPLVDEFVYDLLADFGYSDTDRKVLYRVFGFHFLT